MCPTIPVFAIECAHTNNLVSLIVTVLFTIASNFFQDTSSIHKTVAIVHKLSSVNNQLYNNLDQSIKVVLTSFCYHQPSQMKKNLVNLR